MHKGWNLLAASVLITTSLIFPAEAQEAGRSAELNSSQASPRVSRIDDSYTLGPGDMVQVDVFDVPEFSGENGQYTVNFDGYITLPWIEGVWVQGLTLNETADLLESEYSRYINDPLVTVSMVNARPRRILVSGEVNRPGAYNINVEYPVDTRLQWETATQAIQAAGGITQMADVRNIQVRRELRDGSQDIYTIDLWALINSGDAQQDITLRDGDTVIVPRVSQVNLEETTRLATANFSPEFINVNVVGEVTAPGAIQMPPNATLNQALMAAGGFDRVRANQSSVELIRVNPDGTAERRTINIDLSAPVNDENNPALRNNDILVVDRNGLTAGTDTLGALLAPVLSVLGVFGIVNGLTD